VLLSQDGKSSDDHTGGCTDVAFSISVNAAHDQPPFHDGVNDFIKQFMDPFTLFCEKTIPRKFPTFYILPRSILRMPPGLQRTPDEPPVPTPLVISFDAENFPILPSWDDDEGKPLSEVKLLLQAFFDELWSTSFYFMLCMSPHG